MPVGQIQKNASGDVKRLHEAYVVFLRELADFEKKERELGSQIKKAVNQEKIHNILQKIVNIKN